MALLNIKKSVFVLMVLFSALLLGAKGCETGKKAGAKEAPQTYEINTKEDIIEILPEFKEYSKKFDIRVYDDLIRLITYDDLSFREAVHKLRTDTSMNIPVYIFLNTGKTYFIEKGELKSECSVEKTVSYTGGELRPYIGIIYILDGFWTAIEFNARTFYTERINNDDDKVLVTEYVYVNEAVYKKNGFSSDRGFVSKLDEREDGEQVKGDGSTPYEIITEFDR